MSTVVKCASEAEVRRKLQESQADLAKTVHMMLFGVMGSGKSTILNAVAGVEGLFAASSAARSVTAAASWAVVPYHAGHTLVLCDMPGLMDPANDERNGREANVALQALPELKRAYVLVWSTQGGRLMSQDFQAHNSIIEYVKAADPAVDGSLVLLINQVPISEWPLLPEASLEYQVLLQHGLSGCQITSWWALPSLCIRRGQVPSSAVQDYPAFREGIDHATQACIARARKLPDGRPPSTAFTTTTPTAAQFAACTKRMEEMSARVRAMLPELQQQLAAAERAKADAQAQQQQQQQQQQFAGWLQIANSIVDLAAGATGNGGGGSGGVGGVGHVGGSSARHFINSGETLSGIAQQRGVTESYLMSRNPQIRNPNVIRAGTYLNL